RSGDDLEITVPVSFTELVLGGTITVPTLDSRVRVRIPQGAADGTTLRVRGRGVFTRSGDDLEITVPVSFTELVLGGTITVPTLDSRVRVRIPGWRGWRAASEPLLTCGGKKS
ncbi:hypothetical protein MTQ17_10305, partial [Corynebacterium bovis]|uniref:DnaJ C-terminal domain-containing protein n=1 Tax=Corynebacterium bovis TaxID=36808 RepID=UPI0031387C79